MSEPRSALNGVRFEGIAEIADCGLQGMITLRGDLKARGFKSAVTAAAGVKMPGNRMANVEGDKGLCWMSPDELLLLCPYDEAQQTAQALTDKLKGTHALAVNVSDARALFSVSGPAAREVLAKLSPVDLSPEAFKPAMFRRTRLAQVPAAFWMEPDESFRLICFRSVAQYVFDTLCAAAAPGSAVGVYP